MDDVDDGYQWSWCRWCMWCRWGCGWCMWRRWSWSSTADLDDAGYVFDVEEVDVDYVEDWHDVLMQMM